MTTGRWIPPAVVGRVQFDSGLFSNRWRVLRDTDLIAEVRRDPTRHVSAGVFASGTRFDLVPDGWGTVRMSADGVPLAHIDRRSWWGRRWEIGGTGFACELTSDPLPRRWTFRIGGEPIGGLSGTLWSYNRLTMDANVSIPVHAMILAWHVLARPWEQAAAPRTLVPDRETPA
jgi:hypothetical protein